MYSIDINRIVTLLLPPILRVGKNISFISVPFKVISILIDKLKNIRDNQWYFSQFNSQTIVLQYLLNDLFDKQLHRIYIVNSANIFYPYFYNKSETKLPINLYYKAEYQPFYVKFKSEYQSINDFIVYIPQSNINLSLMKYYIDYYKIAGKKYQIQTY